MSRRPALITQAEIARALRAARKENAREVIVEGGSIRIVLGDGQEKKTSLAKRPAKMI